VEGNDGFHDQFCEYMLRVGIAQTVTGWLNDRFKKGTKMFVTLRINHRSLSGACMLGGSACISKEW
jgi:hypothetical protein